MSRLGLAVMAVAAASVGLLLSGCSADAPARPLSRTAQADAYYHSLDGRWEVLEQRYPGAVRPREGALAVSDGSRWQQRVQLCQVLRINVAATHDGLDETGSIAPGTRLYDLATFACQQSYVTTATLDSFLSPQQASALYDYDVGFLAPCLVQAGMPVGDAPSRSRFVRDYARGRVWTPLDGTKLNPLEQATAQGLLAQRCAPVPAWMRSAR